ENKIDREQRVKKAGFWEIGPIEIDDTDPSKNWSITAATYNWCKGSGTWEDPYIIENITIDGQNLYNCIRIDNSNVYFTIRNCTLINGVGEYWHSGGIRLENVSNGKLLNNDCSFNQQGIYLLNSNNNTLSGNTANNNTIHGIVFWDQCDNTKIIGNTACFNHQGIKIDSYTPYYNGNNLVINNNASYNLDAGIVISDNNNTEILNNNAINNGVGVIGVGIGVHLSRNITISFNHVQGNGYGIEVYNDTNCKIINNTAISNNGLEGTGINIEFGTKLYISDNNVSLSTYGGIMLKNTYNNTVSENTVINNYWGIYLCYTNNNTVLRNIVKENYIGIYLRESNYNNVSGNILIGNDECITEFECEGNIFENNDCGPDNNNPIIPGYNFFLIFGVINVIIIILNKKIRKKSFILKRI
ncbi:MAG: nitrous oxide reductase family maturation protein NosD, partial [Promethearchaeota archaeon]